MLPLLAKIRLASNWKEAGFLVGQTAYSSHDLWGSNTLNGFSVRYSSFLKNWLEMQLISFVKITVIWVIAEPKQFESN